MKFSNEKAHRVIRLTHHTQGEPIRLRLLTHLLLISHRDIIKMYPSQKNPKKPCGFVSVDNLTWILSICN